MKYLDKKRYDRKHADRTHRRVTTGEPCGDVSLCDTCRWPFRRRPVPNSIQRCSDCWQDEAERFAAVMHLVGARRKLWDRDVFRRDIADPPGHAERVALYAARAEAGLPLFVEG